MEEVRSRAFGITTPLALVGSQRDAAKWDCSKAGLVAGGFTPVMAVDGE